ncbi:MAG: M67 family metallopeptidase [Deltaproteobacteria bacterium]|jgi:proteasome lid subunit RPN8/RPN11|nr:M67 family metallopeptidase [Deltaproteobacteria bacterium]
MLKLSQKLISKIKIEAVASYPYECCGLVLGKVTDSFRQGQKILVTNNTREGEDKRRRFVIIPEDFMQGEREALKEGLEIVGIYHSHPDHPAYPSDYDLNNALPFYSYLIVSVRGGEAFELYSYVLKNDRSSFVEEEINYED